MADREELLQAEEVSASEREQAEQDATEAAAVAAAAAAQDAQDAEDAIAQEAQALEDAIAQATQALESDPEIQRLVDDGLLQWSQLLGADGQLDTAAVARVRAMVDWKQAQDEAQAALHRSDAVEEDAEVREFLTLISEDPRTSAVVEALKTAKFEPETWVTELEGMQRDGALLGFVQSCTAAAIKRYAQRLADELERESESEEEEILPPEPIDALAAEQRVKLEMQRRAGLTQKWTCHCMHVNDESVAMHWCEVCRGPRPAEAKSEMAASQEEYAASQDKRKQAVERQRALARKEADRLAEERELQKEFELTGTNRRIEAAKKVERSARIEREKRIRTFILSGSKLLIQVRFCSKNDDFCSKNDGLCIQNELLRIQIGRTSDAEEQRRLAERAALAFEEVRFLLKMMSFFHSI